MSTMKFINYNAQHNFISCNLHQYALLPNGVLKHFKDHHSKELSTKERRVLQEQVNSLTKEHPVRSTYEEFPPHENDRPKVIQGLKLYRHCHQCSHCYYVTVGKGARSNMKTHLGSEHNIRGPPREEAWYSDHASAVSGQQFFTALPSQYQHLRASRVFAVDDTAEQPDAVPSMKREQTPNVTNIEPHTPSVLRTDRDNGTMLLGDLQSQLDSAVKWAAQDRNERLETIASAPNIHTNPWLAHTRFLEVLSAFKSWKEAVAMISIPVPLEEQNLSFLYCVVKSMVRTWQNTTARTSRHARIMVMQEHPQDVPLHPLAVYQNFDLRHAICLQKVFMFFARALDPDASNTIKLQLTHRQRQAWSKIQSFIEDNQGAYPAVSGDHTRTTLSEPEQLCHNFWISLIEQTSQTDDLELSILLPIAVIALNPKATGFKEVYNFATDISAFKKLTRFAAVQAFHDSYSYKEEEENMDDTNDDNNPISIDEAQRIWQTEGKDLHMQGEDKTRSRVDSFKNWVRNYLSCNYPTAMNWMISTAQFASRFRYGENLDAFVHWSGDNVTVRSVRTSLPQLQNAVWNEYNCAATILQQLCFVNSQSSLPSIPWDTLEEQANCATPGYSAFSDTSPQLSKHQGFIRQQLVAAVQNKTHNDLAITDLANLTQITKYGNLVQEFLSHLLCLIHLTSGQPARGTELLSIQHENTAANGLRNIFLFNDLVAVVPRYHKGYNRDKTLKTVYRFLPREVGSLLVWYLWLVRPFYVLLQHQPKSSEQDRHYRLAASSFLWPDANGDQRSTSHYLGKAIVKATMQWMGQAINLSTLRHLLIAFGRKINASNGLLDELTRDEVDDVMDEVEAEAREMQAGHSPQTGHNVYALDISSVFAQKQNLAQTHYKISSKWHQALGFENLKGVKEQLSRAMSNMERSRGDVDLVSLLRENLGPHAQFRGQQKAALEAVMSGVTVIAYVAGTGSGKSLLFLLPACYPGCGQTIVVVPLATLRTDILERCKLMQIRATVWKDGQCDETASIILATPESMAHSGFISLAKRLASMGRLERMVVDEFHYVLQLKNSFRPHLKNLQSLAQYATRVTLLSATIPYEEQRLAYQLMGFSDTVETFREPTIRTNVHYEVHTLPATRQAGLEQLADYARSQNAEFEKILMYVDTRSAAEALARLLQCGLIHGEMTESEKVTQQNTFVASTSGLLVATSAFSAGVHMKVLPAVFRFGKPDSLISWMQESGRAGRDGSPCTARLVLSPGLPNTHYNNSDARSKATISKFIQDDKSEKVCRRQILDSFFDNDKGRKSCKSSEAACDVCCERFYISEVVESTSNYIGSATKKTDNGTPSTPTPDKERGNSSASAENRVDSNNFLAVKTDTRLASSPGYSLSSRRYLTGVHAGSNQLEQSGFNSPSSHGKRPASPLGEHSIRLEGRANNAERTPPVTSTESPIARYRSARQQRQMEFNTKQLGTSKAVQARVFMEELPATQEFWANHCIACFVEGDPMEHPRDQCGTANNSRPKYLGQLVSSYRTAMGNQWGKGQCWACLMPCNCCPQWNIDGTGKTRTQRQISTPCLDKRAIRDTWACLWEKCPKARANWIEWVRGNPTPSDSSRQNWSNWRPGSTVEGLTPQFANYFSSIVDFGDDFKAGRIVLALNWLTHKCFMDSAIDPYEHLLS